MEVGGPSTYRIILYGAVIPESVRDYVFIVSVFAKLLFLLIKPYVQAGIAFFKSINVEVVYQDFGQDCSEQLVWFHFAKITLYSDIFLAHRENPLTPKYRITFHIMNKFTIFASLKDRFRITKAI